MAIAYFPYKVVWKGGEDRFKTKKQALKGLKELKSRNTPKKTYYKYLRIVKLK